MRGGEPGGGKEGGCECMVTCWDGFRGIAKRWALEDGAWVRWKCVDCEAQKHG